LDLTGDNIKPERQQIFLTNLAEVEDACRAAKDKMLALVAHRAQRVA